MAIPVTSSDTEKAVIVRSHAVECVFDPRPVHCRQASDQPPAEVAGGLSWACAPWSALLHTSDCMAGRRSPSAATLCRSSSYKRSLYVLLEVAPDAFHLVRMSCTAVASRPLDSVVIRHGARVLLGGRVAQHLVSATAHSEEVQCADYKANPEPKPMG